MEPVRDDVEQSFAHKVGLVTAGTSIGAHWRLVSEDTEYIAAIVLHTQRPAQHRRRGDGRHAAMSSGVAAHVEKNFGFHRHDRSVFLNADLDAMILLARLIHRFKILRAIFEPTNGPSKVHRGERNQKIFRIKFAARAETAANLGFDKMNTTLRQAAELGENPP